MKKRDLNATDALRHLYPEEGMFDEFGREVTFQVTEACNLSCFPSGTEILMGDKTFKYIEDIEVGDILLGFNITKDNDIKLVKTTVTRLYKKHDFVSELSIGNSDFIHTTMEHPFLVENKTFQKASKLNKHRVWIYKNNELQLHTVTNQFEGISYETVYNLETDCHTFIANNFLVHNCSYCLSGDTEITMSDYSKKQIKDVVEGDKVIGFDEYPNEKSATKIRFADVTHKFERTAETLTLKFDNNIELNITENHKLLVGRHKDKNLDYIEAGNLQIGDTVLFYPPSIVPLLVKGKISNPNIDYSGLKTTKVIEIIHTGKVQPVYNLETSSHTYIANGIAVHNCYQGCKSNKVMSLETGKKIVDLLFKMYDDNIDGAFITKHTKQIILDFIGGEPMLQVNLIKDICDYFWTTAIKRKHIWAETFMVSMASNGTIYFTPDVQDFLYKYRNHISYSVSIDGPKDMHDACRVFPDGKGSFDKAKAAQDDYNKNFYHSTGTKATIARANLPYLSKLIRYYAEQGYDQVHANCVYEEEWNYEDAHLLYEQLKDIADYILNLDYDFDLSFFSESFFHPMREDDLTNWCGGTGKMLAFDPDGNAFPCIRYMNSSLNGSQPALQIGDSDNGIYYNDKYKDIYNMMDKIDRRTQSTDECFYCPIASGCSWCSGWNYQLNGTPDKRCTRICTMHKARSLANVYYWNKYYQKNNEQKYFHRYLSDDEALKIISNDELLLLNNLEQDTANTECTNKIELDWDFVDKVEI